MNAFSGRGEIPHRRYIGMTDQPASGPVLKKQGVSRSGERPEPTVIVRMKENARIRPGQGSEAFVIALGDVSENLKEDYR